MTGTAVEQVEAHDLEARKHLNRSIAAADVIAAASSLLRADLRPQRADGSDIEARRNDVRAIALTLHQHGLPITIQNVNACYVVNGAVEFMTRLWTGLAMARGGHRVWVCDADPAKCTCTAPSSATEGRAHIQRGDDGMTYTATFSWADAERAGLTGSQTYKKFPQDMLGWRALSRAVKRYAPDIVIGVGEAPPDTVRRAAARPLAYDVPVEDDDITDAEIVEQGEDTRVEPPAAEQTAPADRDNVAGEPVVGPAAAPGPRDWIAIARSHGVRQGDLLRQAQEFARGRAVDVPGTLAAISDDEQVEADTLDWLGE